MDNLLKIGFSQSFIDRLVDKYEEPVVYSLNIDYENAYKIISLFHKIGIKNVNDLIYNNIDTFLMKFDDVVDTLREYDVVEVANRTNEDSSYIEEIFE